MKLGKMTRITTSILCFLTVCCLFVSTAVAEKSDKQRYYAATEAVYYVSFQQVGAGTGKSQDNAADFLNTAFWGKVNQALKKHSVKVVFLEGNYRRAFTEKTFRLTDMGHPKYMLVLEGIKGKTVFTADPNEYKETRDILFDILDSQNIQVNNFSFTGNGKVGYALRIRATKGKETKNILVKDCVWTDMRGIIYGTTGVHNKGTSYVTYLNCIFKRVGIDSHSHHIYNSYGASHIYVIDSHFEDCTGDYVRYRDHTDYCVVRGSKFVRNNDFPPYPFISMPNFNRKRTESFGTNYAFYDNEFINNGEKEIRNGIVFHHYGHNRSGFNYLLSVEEGEILGTGADAEKKQLLIKNFGINPELTRVHNNRFSGKIKDQVAVGSFNNYGAEFKGWKGFGDITTVVKDSGVPFAWEKKGF